MSFFFSEVQFLFFSILMVSVCIRILFRSFFLLFFLQNAPTFSRSLAASFLASPGRAAASCSASAAAKPSASSAALAAIGDDIAEEEALCLLEEAAVLLVGGALIQQ